MKATNIEPLNGSNDNEVYLLFGKILQKNGDLEQAERYFNLALNFDPKSTQALHALARIKIYYNIN